MTLEITDDHVNNALTFYLNSLSLITENQYVTGRSEGLRDGKIVKLVHLQEHTHAKET